MWVSRCIRKGEWGFEAEKKYNIETQQIKMQKMYTWVCACSKYAILLLT